MRRNLYLFTNSFPYGKGEKPFVVPELEALIREFNVTIVSHASEAELNDAEWVSAIPEEVRLLHFEKPSTLSLYFLSLDFFSSRAGRRELSDLIRNGFSLPRLRNSLATYANAMAKRNFYRKAGIFSDVESSLYYTFWFNDQNLALGMEKESRPGLNVVSRIHRYELYDDQHANARQPFQRYKKEQADKILFLTSGAERYFEKQFGAFRDMGQHEIVALGTKEAGAQPSARQSDALTIVSCSNLIPVKRVYLIAQAISLLDDLRINWVHFGDGESRESLLEHCRSLKVDIDWRGHTSTEDIYSFYRENYVDVFVTTSASEGSPVSVQEALSFGIPVIGTDVGGICEQIDGNGILLPSNPQAKEVADAIRAFAGLSSEEVSTMRRRSKEIWEALFDSEKNRAKLMAILTSM